MVRAYVEAHTAAHLGRHLCHRLGYNRHLPSSHDILGRHDGSALLPRFVRSRLWAWNPLSTFLLLPPPRNRAADRHFLVRRTACNLLCRCVGLWYHIWVSGWRVLFLVEGLPCIVMGAVAYFFMPDTPDNARFLTADEKVIAKARGVRQVGSEEAHCVGYIRWLDILAALLDLKARNLALSPSTCDSHT